MTAVAIISNVTACLVAMAVCDPLFAGDTLVVHNAPGQFQHTINAQAETQGLNVVYYSDAAGAESAVHLPPYLSRAKAKELLPWDVRAFVRLADSVHRASTNEQMLMDILPRHVRRTTAGSLFSVKASPLASSSGGQQKLRDLLQKALNYAQDKVSRNQSSLHPIALEALLEQQVSSDGPSTIIEWNAGTSHLAQVSRLDPGSVFKRDKTYWLVGLSGALGISLCDWMIKHGARHLILTSRNPQITPEWIKNHERNGVKVAIMPW